MRGRVKKKGQGNTHFNILIRNVGVLVCKLDIDKEVVKESWQAEWFMGVFDVCVCVCRWAWRCRGCCGCGSVWQSCGCVTLPSTRPFNSTWRHLEPTSRSSVSLVLPSSILALCHLLKLQIVCFFFLWALGNTVGSDYTFIILLVLNFCHVHSNIRV